MPDALIISLGGTPEPVIASIETHAPRAVCFFASDQSVDLVGSIKDTLRQKGVVFKDTKVLCDDINDLVHCYERALTCAERLLRVDPDLAPDDVVVDYTGGTKTMTAALALATVGKGFRFSYVGGKTRTKDGLGVVVSGKEVLTSSPA